MVSVKYLEQKKLHEADSDLRVPAHKERKEVEAEDDLVYLKSFLS